MADRICTEPDCDQPFHAKGLCKRHHARANYHANAEERRASQAIYREQHREEARDRAAAWRAAHPERAREATRRWYAEHAAQVLEYRRRYREANRDLIRAQNSSRRARLRGAEVNDLTAEQWTEIKAAFGHRCAYCHVKPPLLTMDHVIPLVDGGGHTASNIVPACQPCNSRKNDGPAPEYQPLLF